jgi:hypothetical protein
VMLRIGNGQCPIYRHVGPLEHRSEMRRLDVAEREEAIRVSVWKRWTAAVALALSVLGASSLANQLIDLVF